MDLSYLLVASVAAALLGAAIVWFLKRGEATLRAERARQEWAAEQAALAERLGTRSEEAARANAALDAARHEIEALRTDRAIAETKAARLPDIESALAKAREETNGLQRQLTEITGRLAAAEEKNARLAELEEQLQAREGELRSLNHTLLGKNTALAELDTLLKQERKQTEEKLALLEQAREQLTKEFQNLANRIFEEKGEKFTAQNKTHLESVLSPLREQLGEFKKRVEDVYDRESKDRVSLHHQIEQLRQLNQRISEDAVNLTRALKGSSKTQGSWGELVLERILEHSGLVKGREYEVQASYQTEEGRRQPDVIVRLPENKDVVIDSKVSLLAYERYCSAVDEATRAAALKEHLAALRAHLKNLSEKNYQHLPGLRTLDFVLMFVPVEPAYLLALQEDSTLFVESFQRQIMVVSPSTLLVTLKTIHSIWRIEYQNQNALEIAKRAGELYDKFVGFVKSLDDIGASLNRAQDAYNNARAQIVSGRGNLVARAEKLRKLGAKARKELPASVIQDAGTDEEEEGSAELLEAQEETE